MIRIDKQQETYTCPYCHHDQSFASEKVVRIEDVGFYKEHYIPCIGSAFHATAPSGPKEELYKSLSIFSLRCANPCCNKITVVGFDKMGNQHDIFPQKVVQQFPEYIPKQIRQDYEEACRIISDSPKAAATLLRRSLQGMIRDFWGVKKGRLIDEIDEIRNKVSAAQWSAIDALRKIGNIGAHMEQDVNIIVNIDEGEAEKLQKLIELLFKNWYVAKHEEEVLYGDIAKISKEKQDQRRKQ